MNALPKQQLHILRHALGLQDDGHPKYNAKESYRNYYVSPSNPDLEALCAAGLMRCDGQNEATGSTPLYRCTDLGKAEAMRDVKPIKRSRSQQNYREFLDYGLGLTFIQFLRWRQQQKKETRGV